MHVKTNKMTTHLISVLGLHEETRPGDYNIFLMLKAELSGSVGRVWNEVPPLAESLCCVLKQDTLSAA